HTGDVLLRMGRSPESYLLAHLNLRDQSFSHCGIVVIENDTPVVYHSIGGEDNPDERLRRDPLSQFVTATNNSSFGVVTYNFSDSDRSRLADTVRRFYARRPFFDLDFDLNTDEKLYCTEFVYKAMMHTFADSSLIGLSTGHGRRFIGIDDLYSSSRARFATRVNYK
ncbi:MAG: hypothetical protein EBZ77_07525, partial [Chitinophagia bacterium]|nr:hypothetical protein [Chitinophagia bacterium]